MDEDGFIYLVDRKKDVIISGGENIYPVQIEDYLRSNSGIKDVAVIGLPDNRLGEIAAAIIEAKPGVALTEKEILEFCRELPRYKRPRKIIFDKVPRNPTGKIEKPVLRRNMELQAWLPLKQKYKFRGKVLLKNKNVCLTIPFPNRCPEFEMGKHKCISDKYQCV